MRDVEGDETSWECCFRAGLGLDFSEIFERALDFARNFGLFRFDGRSRVLRAGVGETGEILRGGSWIKALPPKLEKSRIRPLSQ